MDIRVKSSTPGLLVHGGEAYTKAGESICSLGSPEGGGTLAIRSCEVYNIHLFGDKLDSAPPPPTDGQEDPVPLEIPSSQTVMPSQSPRETAQGPPFFPSSSFPSSCTSGFPEKAQKEAYALTCTVLLRIETPGKTSERSNLRAEMDKKKGAWLPRCGSTAANIRAFTPTWMHDRDNLIDRA